MYPTHIPSMYMVFNILYTVFPPKVIGYRRGKCQNVTTSNK